MPSTNAAEEIIEKKTSSPLATSCLILAVVALLGAIALQLAELGEYRKGAPVSGPLPGAKQARDDSKSLGDRVDKILKETVTTGDATGDATGDGEADPAPATGQDADADAAEPATDAEPETKAEPDAEPAADEADAGEEN